MKKFSKKLPAAGILTTRPLRAAVIALFFAMIPIPLPKAQAVTLQFTNIFSANLNDYYIYFTGDPHVQATYTWTNAQGIQTNSFGTAGSSISTNQVSLGSITGVDISNLTAGHILLTYGQYAGTTTPGRMSGTIGSTNPFQFLEANIGTNAKQTPAAGNLDITYIDAYSFTYIASNSTTGQRVGITNNAKQVTSYLKSISAPGAANFIPTILYVGGRQAIGTASVLGNGSMLTPPQYPLMTNYFNQLIGYTATNPIKIGLSYADTQIPNSAALTNSFKTYANTDLSGSNWGFKVNGTKYQTMVLYGDFQGQMVSNPAVSYGGLALTNGNLGFYLGSGSISIGFWGGNNTASNPFIAQTFTNVALINQGTADQINNDMRLAAQPTNYLNPGQVGLQLNSNYSNMITSIIGYITASGYTGNIQSIAPEIQGNYIGDLYASVMMGVAGSTNVITDGTNSYTMATNDSGWWWMLKSAPQFDQVQANTNNYDPYSAYFYNNSDGTAYGWAYSDRFTANTNPILLTFASNDIVSILVGSPDLITAPTNSSEAASWGGGQWWPLEYFFQLVQRHCAQQFHARGHQYRLGLYYQRAVCRRALGRTSDTGGKQHDRRCLHRNEREPERRLRDSGSGYRKLGWDSSGSGIHHQCRDSFGNERLSRYFGRRRNACEQWNRDGDVRDASSRKWGIR
jgi:hypothetical protein